MKCVLLLSWLTIMEALKRDDILPTTEQRTLVFCVTDIVRQHFFPDRTLMVSSTGKEAHLLNFLLKDIEESRWPLQVSSTVTSAVETRQQHHDKTGSYIIVVQSSEDIEEQASRLIYSTSWNNLARFVIVVTTHVETPQLQALTVIREVWDNLRPLDVLVLVQAEVEIHLYTWFPYRSQDECEEVRNVVLLRKWRLEDRGKAVSIEMLFPNKLPRNFNACPIKISIPFYGTFEVQYISEFLKGLNFTVHVQAKHWATYTSLYDAIRKSVEDVLFGSAEIACGAIPLLKDAAEAAEPSFPYYETKYMWYVPCARQLPRLEAISHIFSMLVWLAFIAAIFVVAVVIWYLASRTLEANIYTTASGVFYNVWAVVMGVSVTELPRSSLLRIVVFAWICHCFAVATVFQTFFTSYLVDPGLEEQITTLEQLLDSGMEFGFRPDIRVYYENSNFKIHNDLMQHKTDCVQTHLCVDRIIETGSFATIAESWSVEKYLNSLNNTDKALVCRMNDIDSFPIRIVSYFAKSSFLVGTFNRLLSSIVESGLSIRADSVRKYGSSYNKLSLKTNEDDYFVFTTTHLLISFFTLAVGYFLCCLAFTAELLFYRFGKPRHNPRFICV